MVLRRPRLVLACAGLSAVLLVVATGTPTAGPSVPQTATTICRCERRIPISSLPYDITAPGSYYVTRDLVGTFAYGIGISADDVTLDLNGYTLHGSGGGGGILVFDPQKNITIRNGGVRGWSNDGIQAGNVTSGRLQHLVADGNGASGLVAGFNCQVLDCSASFNGDIGILARSGSIVSNCSARSNELGFVGLLPANGLLIQGCTFSSNTDDGIQLNNATGCTLLENDCQANADRGIYLSECKGNRLDSNHCASNAVGLEIVGAASQNNVVVRNSCRMNTTSNYGTLAGSDVGPIGTAAASTSPWANL